MGKRVDFYTIAFEDADNNVVNLSVLGLLDEIDAVQDDRVEVHRLVNGRYISIFAARFTATNTDFIRVVPFGKFREDKPYVVHTKYVEELTDEVVELNSLYYDDQRKVSLLTVNGLGPKPKDIEDYLNTFIGDEYPYKIRIRPVNTMPGLDVIRNTQRVSSLTIGVDLGVGVNQMINQRLLENRTNPLAKVFRNMINSSKDELNGSLVQFTLSMGKRRSESIDIQNLINFIQCLNIDEECIKEVIITYENGITGKQDYTKLKHTAICLHEMVSGNYKQISSQLLMDNGGQIMYDNMNRFLPVRDAYFASTIQCQEKYNLIINN